MIAALVAGDGESFRFVNFFWENIDELCLQLCYLRSALPLLVILVSSQTRLVGKGKVLIKCLSKLRNLSLHSIQSDLTAGNAGLLLVGGLQLGNVLQNGANETVGTTLSILVEGGVQGVEVGTDLHKVQLLTDGRADVGLRIRGKCGGESFNQTLVILHTGQSLLNHLRSQNVPIDLGILGVDNLRRTSQPTGVGVAGKESESSSGREGLLNEFTARSLALGHGKGRSYSS